MDWLDDVRARSRRNNQILFGKDDAFLQNLQTMLRGQSHKVVTLWALALAAESVAALRETYPAERRPAAALTAARDWAAGAQAGEMLGAVLRACSQEPVVVLDTGGAVENAGADKTADRIQIANTLGALLKRLLDDGLESTVLIMGGDCLLGLMRQLDVTEIMPLCEVAPGVVLSQFTYGGRQWNLVSKSGGFGAKTLFYDLQNILERWKKELPAV